MFDAVKNYLALASGMSDVTRQRALAAAKALVSSGEATAEQVSTLADDLLTTSRNNRDTVLALIRYEIDRALVRVGLATSEEIAALAQRVTDLEAEVAAVQKRQATPAAAPPAPTVPAAAAEPVGSPPGAPARPAKRATKAARKAPAKRSPAKRAPGRRVAGGPTLPTIKPPPPPDEGDPGPEVTP
jgi:polyhydroxyalkanoate synthesis regulator phasin